LRIAFVIQRYGTEVLGGSESLARQYAACLKNTCSVEVLTTCALDHMTWANEYPSGVAEVEGVPVRRFPNDFWRTPYWGGLYSLLSGDIQVGAFSASPQLKRDHAQKLARWPRALQEELVRWQGPYSTPLLDYLSDHADEYDAFLFFTYLFPTSYYGMQRVPSERIVFCPTLHDEPIAYLPIFRRMFNRPRICIFLTQAERSLAHRLYSFSGESEVVGMGLAEPTRVGPLPPRTPSRYVLYAGRVEHSKGTDLLLDHFLAYKRLHPSNLKLVLIGPEVSRVPRHADILPMGFVPDPQKLALMRQAQALLHPSPFESFSIVLLESFLMGTPALVNGNNEVLVEHCQRSGAGLSFVTFDDFECGLETLLHNPAESREMGTRGNRYVKKQFLTEHVSAKLERILEARALAIG
jgi:glycosyltransferase involved in cell wall biosynthesis